MGIMASPTLITGERDQNIMNLNLTMRTIDEAGLPPLDVLLTEDDKFDGIENINKIHSSSRVYDEIENETLSLNRTDKNDTNVTNLVTEMVEESGIPPFQDTLKDNDEFANQDIDFTTESSLLPETTTFFEEDTCLIWYPDGVFEKLPIDLCTPKNTTVSVEAVETTDYCGKWPWGTQWLCLLIF